MINQLFRILTTSALAVLLLSAPNALSVRAQSPLAAKTVNEVLDQGYELEREHRWQEAIQHYEKAIRKLGLSDALDRRLKIVRIHYDVVRRYSDASFGDAVERTSDATALDLYREILRKLDANYVERIKLEDIVRNGTAFLEVALTERDFVARALPNAQADAIKNFRDNVHKSVLGRPIARNEDAVQLIAQVAMMAQRQIGLPPSFTIHEYASGAVGLLDPYSGFLTAGELNEVMSQIEGNLIGMGVELRAEGEELRIIEVFQGGPAEEAGLRPGDLILRIGNTLTSDVGAKRAADLLRGPEFSKFKLVYQREQTPPNEIIVTRKRVDVPSVSSRSMIDPVEGIGYIRITNFQKTTPREVDEALNWLHSMGMQSLIIDLRWNPGGLLGAAVEIADRFLPSGTIVTTRGKNSMENQDHFARPSRDCETPLVVLINSDSASASEILAGALRDHKRGTLVGQTTYGKGSVQGIFHTDTTNAGLRLTVSKFFSPQGYAISERGIQPHVLVQDVDLNHPTNIAEFISANTAATNKRNIAMLKPVTSPDTTGKTNMVAKVDELRSQKSDDIALRTAIEEARKSTKGTPRR